MASDPEESVSIDGWKYDYVPAWEVSEGGIACIYERMSDILSVYDMNSGEKLHSIDMSKIEGSAVAEYYDGLFYTLNEDEDTGVNQIVVFNELGEIAHTFDIPDEVYDIPPRDPNLPDLLTYGYTMLETYRGQLLLSIGTAVNQKDYYSIDTETGEITKTEAPYTMSRQDGGIWIVKTREGTELQLDGSEDLIGVDDEGNIYTITYHGGGMSTYRRYDSEGKLVQAFDSAGEYSNVGAHAGIEPLPFENDGSLYVMDWDDEGYVLVRVELNP